MNDPYAYHFDPPVLTMVSVYLGDCSGDSLPLACDGISAVFDATTWQRAAAALQHPSPRGPYPVSSVLTIFVHDTSRADSRALSTMRIDVVCREGLAYASVQGSQPRFDLDPVPVVIGDDVVTIARKVVASTQ